jgi:uncharacterized membrane protein
MYYGQEHLTDLDRRRKILCLSAIGLIDFSIISLYQTGVIKKLPDISLPIFDSNKVNAAESAYQFGVPDGPISATVYGLTMALASAGGSEKAGRKPLFDVLLGGAIAGNAAGALYYMYDMIFKQKKICLYCVTGAIVNIASAIIIAPAVLKGIKKLLDWQRELK